MKVRDPIAAVRSAGWYHDYTEGDHMVFRHPSRPGKVVIPGGGKMNRDLKPGTWRSIERQAGLK